MQVRYASLPLNFAEGNVEGDQRHTGVASHDPDAVGSPLPGRGDARVARFDPPDVGLHEPAPLPGIGAMRRGNFLSSTNQVRSIPSSGDSPLTRSGKQM